MADIRKTFIAQIKQAKLLETGSQMIMVRKLMTQNILHKVMLIQMMKM